MKQESCGRVEHRSPETRHPETATGPEGECVRGCLVSRLGLISFSVWLNSSPTFVGHICSEWFHTSVFPSRFTLWMHARGTHREPAACCWGWVSRYYTITCVTERLLSAPDAISLSKANNLFYIGRGVLDFKRGECGCSCHHLVFRFRWLIVRVDSAVSLCSAAVQHALNDGTRFWMGLINDGWICSLLL